MSITLDQVFTTKVKIIIVTCKVVEVHSSTLFAVKDDRAKVMVENESEKASISVKLALGNLVKIVKPTVDIEGQKLVLTKDSSVFVLEENGQAFLTLAAAKDFEPNKLVPGTILAKVVKKKVKVLLLISYK